MNIGEFRQATDHVPSNRKLVIYNPGAGFIEITDVDDNSLQVEITPGQPVLIPIEDTTHEQTQM